MCDTSKTFVEKIFVPFELRPVCEMPDCNKTDGKDKTAQPTGHYSKTTGMPMWRKIGGKYACTACHNRRIAKKRGLKSIVHVLAANAGFTSVTSYTNSKHPYLKYRKTYCENKDGRLGFKCTYKPPTPKTFLKMGLSEDFRRWLEVDHIDGNSYNDVESNLQTLCSCCHSIKTFAAGDNITPGRKTLKKHKHFA
jgi:hypothetical protein